MIEAVLKGKLSDCEYAEDLLISTIFGTLKYLRPEVALIPFIESAFLYNEERTTLGEKLRAEGIELSCYRKVEYIFWIKHKKYGEPDLILIFKEHIQDFEDLLLIVEAKFKSGKSGTEENDQLVRYFKAINNDIGNFQKPVSGFKGRKGDIIYLTEVEACSEISETTERIQSEYKIKENVWQLRWFQLYETFEKMDPSYSSFEKAIVNDLKDYMEKLGLKGFSGIPLPGKSLSSAFLFPYPIFYRGN